MFFVLNEDLCSVYCPYHWIRYRVIQEEKSIFWDVIVSVIAGKTVQWTFLFTMHYIQGDSGGKINIFGCDFIDHCGKKGSINISLRNVLYTGWFRRKNRYFGMWFYQSLWQKRFNKLFSSQCIIYRVIQEKKSIFWDVIVSVTVGKTVQ